MKNYAKPKMKIANVKRCSIIATSGGAGGTIPDAPFHSRRLGDWDDFEDED